MNEIYFITANENKLLFFLKENVFKEHRTAFSKTRLSCEGFPKRFISGSLEQSLAKLRKKG